LSTNEPNLDRDFTFGINLGGINAPTGQGNMHVPEGYYTGTVTDMYVNRERNAGRVIIKLTLIDAPYTGAIRTDGLGIPKNDDDGVRYYWRALAESAGYTPAQLDAGTLNLGAAAFVGKTVHLKYVPKEEGNPDRKYDNVSYLTPAVWNQQKQMASAKPTTPAPAAPAAAPSLNAGPTTVTSSSVLATLGLS
jgi:hypothetical protein